MQTDPLTPRTSIPPPPARQPATGAGPPSNGPTADPPYPTRAGLVWTAAVAVLVFLGLLMVFILQNQEQVYVQYFGLVGSLPLGIALSIAAVLGGLLVAVASAIRIAQLRTAAARLRHQLFRHGHPAR